MQPIETTTGPYEALQAFASEKGLQVFAKAVAGISGKQLSYQAVQKWLTKRSVPADRCVAIEQVTGGEVTRYQLRPDVFGEAPADAMREAG